MRIGIIGTGAMACLFAGRLEPLAEVVLVGSWREQLAALQGGLSLVQADGHITRHWVTATDRPETVSPVDVALVLVKSYQTQAAIGRIRPILADYGPIITLQNGGGNLEQLCQEFGEERTTVGVTSQGAALVRPGVVMDTGPGVTYLAHPARLAGKLGGIITYLRAAHFDLRLVKNADSLIWGKLAVNAGINPLTALLNVPNGFLAENATARQVLLAAAQEVEAVAASQGIRLPYADTHSAAAEALRVAQATADNISSMLQDIRRGSRTEVDAICGVVVEAGRRQGVPTPVNAQLWAWVKAREQQTTVDDWRLTVRGEMLDLAPLVFREM